MLLAAPINCSLNTLGGHDIVYTLGGHDIVYTLGGHDIVYTLGGHDIVYTVGGHDIAYNTAKTLCMLIRPNNHRVGTQRESGSEMSSQLYRGVSLPIGYVITGLSR